MGYSVHASRSNKNNIALQIGTRSRYFSRKIRSSRPKKKRVVYAFESAVPHTNNSIHIGLKVTLLTISLTIYAGIHYNMNVDVIMNRSLKSNFENPIPLENQAIPLENQDSILSKYYDRTIKIADQMLYEGKQDIAMIQFTEALALFPMGKRAIVGLTKSMLIVCRNQNRFCEEAQEYLDYLISQEIDLALLNL